MNGQFFAATTGFAPIGAVQNAAISLAGKAKINWPRLLAALGISCAFHTALVLAPHLGSRMSASGGGAQGKPQSGGARLLKATLAPSARQPSLIKPAAPAVAPVVEAPVPAPVTPPSTKAEPGSASDSSLGAGVLPIDAPIFHTADQLTQRPRPINPPNLDALATGNPPPLGNVILRLWIADSGRVVSVEIEESQVPPEAANAAAAAFAKLRFAPGEINGRPVGAIMRIEVTYDAAAPELPPALPAEVKP